MSENSLVLKLKYNLTDYWKPLTEETTGVLYFNGRNKIEERPCRISHVFQGTFPSVSFVAKSGAWTHFYIFPTETSKEEQIKISEEILKMLNAEDD
jgi:hypothetical protein